MEKKCSLCKTSIFCRDYETKKENFSGLVGKIIAHWQTTHGVPIEMFLYCLLGSEHRFGAR